MQRLLSMLVLGLACTLGLGTVGCSKKDKDKADTAKADTGRADTGRGTGGVVVYEYPTEVLVLKQGEKKTFDVTRKGKALKASELKIESSDPSVTVEGGSFKDEDKTATVTILTTKDTPAKEHTLKIKAGDKTEIVKIRVDKSGTAEVIPPAGDTGKKDAGKTDTGKLDTGKTDTGKKDTGKTDTGKLDTGKKDTGKTDTGKKDASKKDAGKGAMLNRLGRDLMAHNGREEAQVEARITVRREFLHYTREF